MQYLGTTLGVVLAIVCGGAWTLGGLAGVVYWALKDETVNALLSVFIPLYGAVSVILDVAT